MRTGLRIAAIVFATTVVTLAASVAFAPNPKAAKYICICILADGRIGPHLRATADGLAFGGGAHWFRREGDTIRLYLRGHGTLPKQDGDTSRPGLSFQNKTMFVVRDANGGK